MRTNVSVDLLVEEEPGTSHLSVSTQREVSTESREKAMEMLAEIEVVIAAHSTPYSEALG